MIDRYLMAVTLLGDGHWLKQGDSVRQGWKVIMLTKRSGDWFIIVYEFFFLFFIRRTLLTPFETNPVSFSNRWFPEAFENSDNISIIIHPRFLLITILEF